MISSVSFASAQAGTTSFEDKIKQPQAFVTKEVPQAATGINNKTKYKQYCCNYPFLSFNRTWNNQP